MFEKVDEFELTQEQWIAFLLENLGNAKKAMEGQKFSYISSDPFRIAFSVAGTLDDEPDYIRQYAKAAYPEFIEKCKELMQDTARAMREFDWLPKELP